jgi:hypothetical protein
MLRFISGAILGSLLGILGGAFAAGVFGFGTLEGCGFVCSVYSGSRYCGRRAALLYGAGKLFACRRCYGLAYASQHEGLHHRGLGKAQKIRMQLGGSPNMSAVAHASSSL